jgi:NitT/TauT family transport system permease protein
VLNTNIFEQILFPFPKEVMLTLLQGFSDHSFFIAIITSLKRLLIGYTISLIIGIPLGLGIGRLNWFNDTIVMLALGLQALPSICWLPLAVLWFGLNEIAIQFVIIMGSLLSIAFSVRDGVG